jgi:hypothetical protein
MTIYEMRTYTLQVGKMTESVQLYTQFGYRRSRKGGHDKKLIGYLPTELPISLATICAPWKSRRAHRKKSRQREFSARQRGWRHGTKATTNAMVR